MSTWSVLPEAGSPETILFASPSGSVTRADVERLATEECRRSRDPAFGRTAAASMASAQPLPFLLELVAAWSQGRVVVLSAGGRQLREEPALRIDSRACEFLVHSDQVLVELSTSGTTGRPERYAKTALQLLGEARVLGPLLGLGPGSVVLSTVSLHHLYGLLFGLMAPVAAGACIVNDEASDPARFHPHRVAQAARDHRVTHLVTIPAHIRSLLDAKVPLSGLRVVVSSAAALPVSWAQDLEERSGAEVLDVLGSTESGGVALRATAREKSYRPLPEVAVRVSSDEHLEVISPFAGRDEPLRTGDRVRLLEDGTFLHLGRDDGVIKIAGKRFSLQELEQSAESVPGVSAAMAFARQLTGSRGTEVWLVVASESLDPSALRAELARRVDPVLVPRRVRILRQLPRDVRGKLPRAALQRYVTLPGFDFQRVSWDPFRLEVRLREDSSRLEGHFPGAPVLPAVAQLVDLIAPEVERLAGAPVVEARRLKWQAPVLPGQTLVVGIDAASGTTKGASEGALAGRQEFRFRMASPAGVVFSTGILVTSARDLR